MRGPRQVEAERKFKRIERKEKRADNVEFYAVLRNDVYRNPSNKTLFTRGAIPKKERKFAIWWCNPETHYRWKRPPIRHSYRLPPDQSCRFKLHYMQLQNPSIPPNPPAAAAAIPPAAAAAVPPAPAATRARIPGPAPAAARALVPGSAAARPRGRGPGPAAGRPRARVSDHAPVLAPSLAPDRAPATPPDRAPVPAPVPAVPARVVFHPEKTRHLRSFLLSEYRNLDYPKHTEQFIQDSYNRHLAGQTVLDQEHCLEMMLSCHYKFQIGDLLIDMRHRAMEFANRENCPCKGSEKYPGNFEMRAEDVRTLIRDILGRSFHPVITTKRSQDIKI